MRWHTKTQKQGTTARFCPFQKWIALISEVDLSEREEMGISNVRDFRNTMCPF